MQRPLRTILLTTNYSEMAWETQDTEKEAMLLVPRAVLMSELMQRLYVNLELNALFCPITGVAADGLLRYFGGHNKWRRLDDFALRDRERWLVREQVTRFVFVRHPVARLMELYFEGVHHDLESEAYASFMAKVRGEGRKQGVREVSKVSKLFFFAFLGRRPHTIRDEFSSMSDKCGLDVIDYHVVGRGERIEKDVAKVAKRVGWRSSATLDKGEFWMRGLQEGKKVGRTQRLRIRASRVCAQDLIKFDYAAENVV